MKRSVKQRYGRKGRRWQLLAGKLSLVGLVLAFLLGAVGMGGVQAWQSMGQWSFFQLTAIGIDGCVRTSKKEILELSGLDVHSNLLTFSAGQARAAIEKHEWVESALVRRDWPNRLQLVIRERQPAALLSLPEGLYYLDRHGVAFAEALPPDDLDFPVITGLPGLPETGGWLDAQRRGLDRALALIRLAGRGGVILPAQGISEINLDENGALTLFLVSRPFPIHLGEGREIGREYNRLVRVLSRLYRDRIFAEIAAIRMDYLPNRALIVKAGG